MCIGCFRLVVKQHLKDLSAFGEINESFYIFLYKFFRYLIFTIYFDRFSIIFIYYTTFAYSCKFVNGNCNRDV